MLWSESLRIQQVHSSETIERPFPKGEKKKKKRTLLVSKPTMISGGSRTSCWTRARVLLSLLLLYFLVPSGHGFVLYPTTKKANSLALFKDGRPRRKPADSGHWRRQPSAQRILSASALRSSSKETSRSGSSSKTKSKNQGRELTVEQLDFVRGYLNKHHGDFLLLLARNFSPLGAEMAKANVWSGGSYSLESTRLVDIVSDNSELRLDVTIEERNKPARQETISIPLDAMPIPEKARQVPSAPPVPDDGDRLPVDDLVRRLCRLTWMIGTPEVSGKLVQLAIQLGGAGIGKLPENLYLNQVPHNRYG